MIRRIRWAVLALVPLAAWVAMAIPAMSAANAAFAVTSPPGYTLKAVGTGSSAHLQTGVNPAGVVLTVSDAGQNNNAQIDLTNVAGGIAANVEPTISLTNPSPAHHEVVFYLAAVNSADVAFGYPAGFPDELGTCEVSDSAGWCWFHGNTPVTWSQVKDLMTTGGGLATATLASDIVSPSTADSYSTTVGSLTWNGSSLLPQQVPDVLTAKYFCGTSWANHVWRVTNVNVGGHMVSFAYSIRLASGRVLPIGTALVGASSSTLVATHRGIGPLFVKWSSMGQSFTTKAYVPAPAHQVACS